MTHDNRAAAVSDGDVGISRDRRVVVVNPGSSSVKIDLLDGDDVVLHLDVAADGGRPDEDQLADALRRATGEQVDAVAVRVVHGGPDFSGPVRVTGNVRDRIAALAELAPLHQGPALALLDRLLDLLADTPVIACFDTTFHRTIPVEASTYAVPRRWREELHVRRYGFHGLAHAWNARRAAELLDRRVDGLSLVSAHLGSGASLCAVRDGRSLDTTMGFTPLSGLVMGTRSGDLDPAVPGYVVAHGGGSPALVAGELERESGLFGLAGTADAARVVAAAADGDCDSATAVAVWGHRLRAGIAAMVAALDGRLDAMVFSGGIGEHSPVLRAQALDRLGWLGLRLDPDRNAASQLDSPVSPAGVAPVVLLVHAREDAIAAAQARSLLD